MKKRRKTNFFVSITKSTQAQSKKYLFSSNDKEKEKPHENCVTSVHSNDFFLFLVFFSYLFFVVAACSRLNRSVLLLCLYRVHCSKQNKAKRKKWRKRQWNWIKWCFLSYKALCKKKNHVKRWIHLYAPTGRSKQIIFYLFTYFETSLEKMTKTLFFIDLLRPTHEPRPSVHNEWTIVQKSKNCVNWH